MSQNVSTNGEWEEQASKIVNWEQTPEISGVLRSVTEQEGQFGLNTVYQIDAGSGLTLTVFGTVVLRQKLATCQVGDQVRIEYIGHGPDGRVKEFRVWRRPGSKPVPF